MAKKDGMYCYYDWIKPLKKVPDEDFKQLFIAMLEYQKDGTPPPKFEGVADIVADFIFPQLDRSKRYAECGELGGMAKAKNNKQTVTDEATENSNQNDVATSENEDAFTNGRNKKETDVTVGNGFDENASTLILKQKTKTKTKTNTNTNTETDTNTSPPQKPPVGGGTCVEGFARFWEAYPKKVGKIAAERNFRKLSPDGALLDRMLSAIDLQKRSEQWRRDGGQYIPNPATWLSQGRWEDEAVEILNEVQETSNPFLAYLNRLQAEEEAKIYTDFEEVQNEQV